MPTTLPVRSPHGRYGRAEGFSRSTALLLMWAIAMIALTLPVDTAHTADADQVDTVLR